MPVHGIDHLELYVGNAAQAAFYFTRAFGFAETAYSGLETGRRDRVSHVLEQGRIRLVVTGTLSGDDEIGEHHKRHGDGVHKVALSVPDAAAAYWHAVEHGARGVTTPAPGGGRARRRAALLGGHLRRHPPPVRAARRLRRARSCRASRRATPAPEEGLFAGIDHVVGNVELGHMEEWVGYYERVFGMTELIHFSDEAISTEYSALMSKVVTDGSGRLKFPINEPAEGKRKSQIDEYLDFYRGAGRPARGALDAGTSSARSGSCASAASSSSRSPRPTTTRCRAASVEIEQDLGDLRRLGILVDRDDEGYLLQIFTKPLGDRPTLFFEVIERHGSRGFGEGNFKALFEAIEREQERRGNL